MLARHVLVPGLLYCVYHDPPDEADKHDHDGGGDQDPHARVILDVIVIELVTAAKPEENAQPDEGQHKAGTGKTLNFLHLDPGLFEVVDAVHIEGESERAHHR